jgi:hypothetical protein
VGTLNSTARPAPSLREQALLADDVPAAAHTRMFGWYTVGSAAGVGSLAAGAWLRQAG